MVAGGANELACGINWDKRAPTDAFQKGCGLIGFLLIFIQMVISIVLISGSNGYINFNMDPGSGTGCDSGYVEYEGYQCISAALYEDYTNLKCQGGGAPRWLRQDAVSEFIKQQQQTDAERDTDSLAEFYASSQDEHAVLRRLEEKNLQMWDRMAQNAEIPAVLVPLVLVVGVLWVLLLQKAAKPCIWGAIVFCVAICIFFAVFPVFGNFHVCEFPQGSWAGMTEYPMSGDMHSINGCRMSGGNPIEKSGDLIVVFFIPAVVIMVLAYLNKKNIDIASKCLSKCCQSLHENPSILLYSLGVFAYFLLYQGLWVGAILSIFNNFKAECTWDGRPGIQLMDPDSTQVQVLSILLPISYVYFEMMIVVVVACGVGGWYFQDDPARPANASKEGLKWAYSTSSGAVMLATVITYPIVQVRNYIHSHWAKVAMCPCVPCSWVYYILYILWCCVLRAYLAFTRFMLISHTFHGGDMFQVARKAWAVLKKHLGGAVVTDTLADMVLDMGVTVISISFAVGAWAWMEAAIGEGFLSDVFAGVDATTSTIIVVILLGVVMWFCKHSLVTIILIALVGSWVNYAPIQGFLCGLFTGAVCNLMFSFLAKVIHAGMDTIFYCFALEAEYAQAQSREGFADLHACIKADIVKPVPDYLMEENSTVIQPEYGYQNNNVVEPGKPVYNNGVEPGKPEY